MLRIRQEQMDIFQQQAEINFIDSVVKHIRTDHAEIVQDISEDKLYKRVEYGIQRAREYGLSWRNNLNAFVTLMFEIGPDFDRFPAFQKFLTDENVLPNKRMGVLLRETTDLDWQNARQASAPDNWPEEML